MESQELINKSLNEAKEKMLGSLNALKHSLSGLRTGRASSALLENVRVEAYGSLQPLNQVATINVADARMLTVQVWDQGLAKAAEKAIMEASLGLNPITEGAVIRVPIPPLSEERRKELARKAHEYGENAKVAIRNIRRHAMDELKIGEKDKILSEDDHRVGSRKVQDVTDECIEKVDAAIKQKSEEILSF